MAFTGHLEVTRSSYCPSPLLGQSWDDIIRVMTSATVRFELLSTVHTSPVSPALLLLVPVSCISFRPDAHCLSVCLCMQVTLDVQRDGGVSTKGPRGGVFVMYNCARLHTLFNSYERGVEKGEGT